MSRPLFSRTERAWLLGGVRASSAAFLASLGAALVVAMLSYEPTDPGYFSATFRKPQNLLGEPGAMVADLLHRSIGVAGYALGALAIVWALRILLRAWPDKIFRRLVSTPFALLCLAALLSGEPDLSQSGGGLGGLLGDTIFSMMNTGLPLESSKIRYLATIALLALLAPPLLLAAFGGNSFSAVSWLNGGFRELARVAVSAFHRARSAWARAGGDRLGAGLIASISALFAGWNLPKPAMAGAAVEPGFKFPKGGAFWAKRAGRGRQEGSVFSSGRETAQSESPGWETARVEPSPPSDPAPRRKRILPKAPPATEPGFHTARRSIEEPGFSSDAPNQAPHMSEEAAASSLPTDGAPMPDAVPAPDWAITAAAAGAELSARVREAEEALRPDAATGTAPVQDPPQEPSQEPPQEKPHETPAPSPMPESGAQNGAAPAGASSSVADDGPDLGADKNTGDAQSEEANNQRSSAATHQPQQPQGETDRVAFADLRSTSNIETGSIPIDESSAEGAVVEGPSLDLLADAEEEGRPVVDERVLAERADRLQKVLQDYGVKGDIIHVSPGPVVSLFELEPAPGLKAARVVGLADDIARSMSAAACRVSPVPGKNLIGIELPNENRETVLLSELLASDDYQEGDWTLPLALGKDIAGEPVIADLARMPHLLIAGTTGSGKSVAINTMLLSLLYRLSPEEARLILIDPKMLELSVYNGAPHLLAPVVTDPKQAVAALRWVVREMETRYQRMAKLNVRSLESYNAKIAEAGGETLTREVQVGFCEDTGQPLYQTQTTPAEPMARIVVVIDEMADLMLVAGKEIERLVQRLAQMARAAGIHLVMATQRPSVDVITGVIKANFPIRISFQVTSKIDSRTILNEPGAEQLLGKGDMLFTTGSGKLQRLHGPFVSDAEVEAVAARLQAMGPIDEPVDFDARPETSQQDDGGASTDDDSDDALYERAVAIVRSEQKASTSFLQRRLQIGYNRAARLVDRLEEKGVISPANHAGRRDVLGGGDE